MWPPEWDSRRQVEKFIGDTLSAERIHEITCSRPHPRGSMVDGGARRRGRRRDGGAEAQAAAGQAPGQAENCRPRPESEGQQNELDIDGTIDATAKNAGELEIITRAPRKSNVRVLLLMDVGGSMDPHVEIMSRLFSAAKRASNIRELKTYYFHNCVYGRVYETERFSEPQSLDDLLHELGPAYKLIMVGDAAMHPAELLGAGDYEYYGTGHHGPPQTGMKWLVRLADHFRRFAWLNPDPPSYWRGGTADAIGKVFPMFQLTLDGLSDAIAHLSKGDIRKK